MSAEEMYHHERGRPRMYDPYAPQVTSIVREIDIQGNPYEGWGSVPMTVEGPGPCRHCGGGGCTACMSHVMPRPHMMPPPMSTCSQAARMHQPVNHEYDRVLLNPPTVSGCNAYKTPQQLPLMNSSISMPSSCNTGCSNAQFVLESAPRRC